MSHSDYFRKGEYYKVLDIFHDYQDTVSSLGKALDKLKHHEELRRGVNDILDLIIRASVHLVNDIGQYSIVPMKAVLDMNKWSLVISIYTDKFDRFIDISHINLESCGDQSKAEHEAFLIYDKTMDILKELIKLEEEENENGNNENKG